MMDYEMATFLMPA